MGFILIHLILCTYLFFFQFDSSLLDMANSKLNKTAVNALIESICKEHGLEEQTEINFENFCQILSPQMDKLWNAGLDWKGECLTVPDM